MTTKKTKEELREIEEMKDRTKKEKEELKRKEREDRFMSHFERVDDNPYTISDEYTQLEHVLGNIHKFTDRGFKEDGKLHPGDEFFIFINKDQNDPEVRSLLFTKEDYENKSHIVKTNIGTKKERLTNKLTYRDLKEEKGIGIKRYRVVAEKNDPETGLNCAVIQCIEYNNKTGQDEVTETILWADGSKGFNNFWEASGLKNKKVVTKELMEDWLVNNVETAFDKINKQTEKLYEFAENYNYEHPDQKIEKGIGVSLAALAMGTLAHTKLFEDINVKAHSGVPPAHIVEQAKARWGDNELKGSNIEYYLVPNELLFQLLRGYFDDAKLFIKDESNYPDITQHGPIVYNNKKGDNETYHQYRLIKDFPMWKLPPNHNKVKNIPVSAREVTNDFDEFISDPDRYVYVNDEVKNTDELLAVQDNNFNENLGYPTGMASNLVEMAENHIPYTYDRADYVIDPSFSPTEREIKRLERSITKMKEQMEKMQVQLDFHEKVVNIYNYPDYLDFYLDKPVRNIIKSFLIDYCIMEGIDYEHD